jgi:hypothetical protein
MAVDERHAIQDLIESFFLPRISAVAVPRTFIISRLIDSGEFDSLQPFNAFKKITIRDQSSQRGAMGLRKLSVVETMSQDHIVFKGLSDRNAAGINSGSLKNNETGGFFDPYKIYNRFH